MTQHFARTLLTVWAPFFWALVTCLTQPADAQTAQAVEATPNPLALPSAVLPNGGARTLGGGLSPDSERSRIQEERTRLDALFMQAQAVCYQKFAVENCLSGSRLMRREALADLRRQEISLNAAQARLKGAEQLSRVDNKSSAQAELDNAAQRTAAQEKQQARLADAEAKAANRAATNLSQGLSPGPGSDALAPDSAPTRAEKKAQSKGGPAAKARAAALRQKQYEEKQKQGRLKAGQRRKRQAKGPAAPV